MSTLEDKILGERLHYYCSSSSDDEENDSADSDKESEKIKCINNEPEVPEPSFSQWNGTASNTGPKGVMRDWQRYKQLKADKRQAQEREMLKLLEKICLTCRSSLDEEKQKLTQTDPELADLLGDEFLLEYQRERMKEMLAKAEKLCFGTVYNLESAEQFLEAIDNEDKYVTVIVHIYEESSQGCIAMNGCLISLAQDYPNVKFCKILGSTAGLSKHFKKEGIPALLIYKGGQVIGNFVRVTDHLGHDFFEADVEQFLIEHGMLNDKICVPTIIRENEDKSDSD